MGSHTVIQQMQDVITFLNILRENEEVQCEQDVDDDGICEDHCEEMLITVVVVVNAHF